MQIKEFKVSRSNSGFLIVGKCQHLSLIEPMGICLVAWLRNEFLTLVLSIKSVLRFKLQIQTLEVSKIKKTITLGVDDNMLFLH